MKLEYNQVPDLNDKTKWLELEVKKEPIYGNSGNLIVPIGEKKYYREIKNKKIGSGMSIAITLFEKEHSLLCWSYAVTDRENRRIVVGYMALRMKNGKWAVSNLLINGVSIEKDENILHLHIYEKEAWIFLKAKKGWAMRKINPAPFKNK